MKKYNFKIEKWFPTNAFVVFSEKEQRLLQSFHWLETGLQLQIQFINNNYQQNQEVHHKYDSEVTGQEIGSKLGLRWNQVGTKLEPAWNQVITLLDFSQTPRSIKELMKLMGWSNRTKFRGKYINPLLDIEILNMTIPKKPSSSKQQYYLTEKGTAFLSVISPNS